MLAIAALAFIAAFLKIAFPIIVLGAALIGICAELAVVPSSIREEVSDQKHHEFSSHTPPSARHFVRSLATWLTLWLAPMIALLAIFGPQNIYTQIAFVFGKVAMMAIGGDFAVTSTLRSRLWIRIIGSRRRKCRTRSRWARWSPARS
jgi:chromate transporter